MNDNSVDGFELYRRQRQRVRRIASGDSQPISGVNNALRELEAVEAREDRDRHLQREVSDFFESARLTAVDIVQKVAEDAKEQTEERLGGEVHEFLLDSLTRMQALIEEVLARDGDVPSEQVIEPQMHNMSGRALDSFRQAGIGADSHMGQDPMKTDLDDVRREFQQRLPEWGGIVGECVEGAPQVGEDAAVEVIEEVAEVTEDGPVEELVDSGAVDGLSPEEARDWQDVEDDGPAEDLSEPAAPEPVEMVEELAGVGVGDFDQGPQLDEVDAEMARFLRALQNLVEEGSMTAEEVALVLEVRQSRAQGPRAT